MISKTQISLITSLRHKKFRKEHGLFVAEGAKIADELIASRIVVRKIYALPSWIVRKGPELSDETRLKLEETDERILAQLSALSTPQEVLVLAEIPKAPDTKVAESQPVVLALDRIQDPGNMGTLIRLADWYGLQKVICSPDCADVYNEKTVQASMGSIIRTEAAYTDLPQWLAGCGRPVYAATLNGEINVHSLHELQPCVLVIGNEARGISEEVLAHCTHQVMIPRFGHAESLNAAMAAGILLDNFVRVLKNE